MNFISIRVTDPAPAVGSAITALPEDEEPLRRYIPDQMPLPSITPLAAHSVDTQVLLHHTNCADVHFIHASYLLLRPCKLLLHVYRSYSLSLLDV